MSLISLSPWDLTLAAALVLLLAGCVALMMTGSGVVGPIFARRIDELGGGVRTLGWLTMSFALVRASLTAASTRS